MAREARTEDIQALVPVVRAPPEVAPAEVPTGVLTPARIIDLQGSAIVGVLIPEGGEPIFLQSGGGQGFSSHIEGKATAVMRERGITRAKLLVELEPCQICDRSTYPGPNVPSEGVPGTASGKNIPLQTSKINTALPRGTKITVVGPESTGIYEGVVAPGAPRTPTVPPVSDPHPDPGPAKTTPKQTSPSTPAPVPAPKAEGTPKPGAPQVKVSPLKSAMKAGLKAAGWAVLFLVLDYLAVQALIEQVEADIEKTRPHMKKWAEREKAKAPDKPAYLQIKIVFDDYQKYFPLMGWLPDRKMYLSSVAIATQALDPPKVDVEDHSLDFFRSGKTIVTTYTELLIP
jgi:hypothetical protein